MVLTRLTSAMAFCSTVLTAFEAYIAWQDKNFRQLPACIGSVLGEDPRATLYASQLQYYIDRIFNTAESMEIHIQHEALNIGVLLNNVHSLSIRQLYLVKERIDILSDILVKLLKICNEAGTTFLHHFKVFIENLILENVDH